jgi:asparagine synthase (glutamine-hydrolysing)
VCGIIGIKLFQGEPKKSDQTRVEKGLETQNHRGPDYTGFKTLGTTVFGHNRLSIIDLKERSNQPFQDKTERYSIVFNGEIYNYPELKNELLQNGFTFETSSDTEVLLYHLIQNGTDGIDALDGCFAFAFYDSLEDELILARDHMGINPLLFSIQENEVLFASELHGFKYLLPNWSINTEALNDYFRFTYVPAPKTMLNEVQKLLPGHYLKIKGKDLDMVKYYQPNSQIDKEIKYETAVGKTKKLVERAVIKRMNADVPLGTFLSGGLDSSIVSAIAADFKSELNTYSIGFKGNNFFDESGYAQKVADHIHSVHHAIQLEDVNVITKLTDVLNAFDEPFADSSAIAMYFLSEKAKQNLTVCLSGDGADELFAGYNKHKAFLKSQKPGVMLQVALKIVGNLGGSRNGKVANKLRQLNKFKTLITKEWPEKYWFLASFIDSETRNSLLKTSNESESKTAIGDESLNNFLKADQSFVLPNDMLKKVDLMSMSHSLEVRTPFLDRELVDFVNTLPENYKYENGVGKRILRDAFREMLPDEIFTRSKKGFEVPLQEWISKSWDKIVNKEWFEEDFLRKQDVFRLNGVESMKKQFFSNNPGESAIVVWAYIVFQNWYSRWTEK